MAESAYLPGIARQLSSVAPIPRHSLAVRITHWINAIGFGFLLVSGVAILLAHPRLYWGETGAVGGPSLIDLPLPFMLTGQSGWGRSQHFLFAWVAVINGAAYIFSGLFRRHFASKPGAYSSAQWLTYLAVVFLLFPLMIWTGLAMSPSIVSVFPLLVTAFGGQQSARTIHFFCAALLVVFLVVHVAMVIREGFVNRVRGMITGRL